MNDEIKIQGETGTDPESCRFTVDRPVYEGRSAFFGSREMAKQSALASSLFDVPTVQSVLIAGNQITVSKSGYDPWPVVGKQIGAKIREHLRSGKTAVSEEFEKGMLPEKELRKRIEQVLKEEINPAIAMHGGFVDLIEVKNNSVYLRLGGGCQGCASALMTLRYGIEKTIRQLIPQVGEILDTTDHAAGRNPYYTAG